MSDPAYPSFLIAPGARMTVSPDEDDQLVCDGNGAALASLAGLLLWRSHSAEHALPSLTGLPFVEPPADVALTCEVVPGDEAGAGGVVSRPAPGRFVWQLDADELLQAALALHALAARTPPDYAFFPFAEDEGPGLTFVLSAAED